ncbi:MAG: hypothetical protein HY606_09105 [Planctomycetes bacterium]|nr:hypothetical protein [Planctomycetota bacterium]
MSNQRYKIQKIGISNFRGITEGRTIEVAGKHLFLLGPNGFGKSTVVEAIRWCLFGSTGQQEIEVRNTFYPSKASEVVINLVADNKALNVRRLFSPGASRSRPTITDRDGKDINLEDAFPQIARLGPPTGTQVIFAAQHAAGRQQAEIQDFSKVLYFYLAIEEIPELLENLHKLTEERRAEREAMAKSLDDFAQELRNNLAVIQGKKEEISKNPPWGKGSIPTRTETERKIDLLFHDMARLVDEVPPADLSCHEKLQKIEEWSGTFASSKQEHLRAKSDELQIRRDKAQITKDSCQNTRNHIDATKNKKSELEDKERSLLKGQTLKDLRAQVEEAKKAYDEDSLRSEIMGLVATYRDNYNPSHCPACNSALASEKVGKPQGMGKDRCSELEEITRRVNEITAVRGDIDLNLQSLSSLEKENEKLTKDVQKTTGKINSTMLEVDHLIQELDSDIRALNEQLKDAQSECDGRNRRINERKAEERFHYYQEQVAAIEKVLSKDIEVPRNALAEYDDFLATIEAVGKLLLEAFNKQIDSAIPPLAERLTGVYAKLTGHPSYDGVAIAKQTSVPEKMEPGRLELQVTSSKCPGRSFPVNVLNGQAARALQLVPYFVFSDYWHNLMELDLLLVDDPSESFDTSHLENLMQVLHSVASHTQLVIASHEGDRMLPLIEKYFPINERCVIAVIDFDPFKGPTFEQR